ncbi:MAG: hypothetical protein A2589_00275 [Candidatus Vogelbacteria bacterium RIFOXYD1_FULL_46_19]|uniref:Uncharacterized protein n=1 Tax=Candidatus Vogelbacteria bacterium RIFOXYD1_FULL_46_19 TaxID=1802439 RepID=A0A1G2QHR2_9BACT|nr:MAG: hypothetical protein A2589_00275 [Candidatus Vogelbacteria bacterium RIFOXYD1_FULL_46_19]
MKKKTPESKANKGAPKKDQYTVVLEDLRSQFKIFGEGLLGLNQKVETKFSVVEKKLDSHTERMGQILLDLADIKYETKQKVDRQEFARLEKRVIMLERKVK